MNIKLTDLFTAELEREAKGTRRALERVPDGRHDFQPHKKSMTAGSLANLVSGMPGWISMMIDMNELDLNPPGGSQYRPPKLSTSRELVEAHDAALAKARESLAKTTDEHLMKPWKLLVAGKVVAENPRHIMIRETINHLAHHRGQLTVFLRLLEVPVPAIYGPSADDAQFD
jgi:uncharacterized damage-inducible protein DinB